MHSRNPSGRAVWGALACAAVVASGCNDTRASEAALRVTVRIGAGVKANCVRVYATPQGGDEQTGTVLPLDGRTSLIVAIYRSPALSGAVEVGARGFVGAADCSGKLSLNEESEAVEASFVDGEVVPIEVALEKVPDAFDVDHDGWRASGEANGNGLDCDDAAAAAFPGNAEVCGDGLDNDCNGQSDCADAACDAKTCDDGRACTVGETCQQGACTGGAAVSCDQAPGECFIGPGTCVDAQGGCVFAVRTGQACSMGTCRQDGLCVDQTVEAICDDGVDNDTNGKIDCADPDCAAQPCTGPDKCAVYTTCASGACQSTPKSCLQTANECEDAAGTCNPADGSCAFTPKPLNTPCTGGECHANGTCGDSEKGVQCGDGKDNDGDGLTDCDDPSCDGQSCDALNLCFMGKVCDASSKTCTGGTKVSCAQPGVCQTGGTCDPAQGCTYTPTPDAACPNGFCGANGLCQAPFPYTPSNFDPLQYAPAQRSGPYVINCGVVAYDTSPNALNSAWCGVAAPAAYTVTQPGGIDVVVLPIKGLSISAGNNGLSFTGSRPVILAVYGDATVSGFIRTLSEHATPGAGGNSPACAAGENGGVGGAANNEGGGGGGGGFGTGGAGGGTAGGGGAAGAAGAAKAGAAALSPLRGGCHGGAGGDSGGASGAGGGAIQLSVSGTLNVTGGIAAPGGGGTGAAGGAAGGGGGGSGGAILLEGASVSMAGTTVLSVTGGGGGEGGGSSTTGNNGANGPQSGTTPANGGGGASSSGGNGGNGATAGSGAQVGANGSNGGGGGGGGTGFIRINASSGCTGGTSATLLGSVSSTGANCP